MVSGLRANALDLLERSLMPPIVQVPGTLSKYEVWEELSMGT